MNKETPKVCPKCGCQTRSPFSIDVIIHDINKCGGVITKTKRK